jgi:sulfhydrogenase subunit beta (sulfur reductase)
VGSSAPVVLDIQGLDALIGGLRERGYTVVGPTLADEAIVLDEVAGVDDLPAGWGDEQEAGTYRLRRRADGALFGFSVGPVSWKRFLFPPRTRLLRARRTDAGYDWESPAEETPRLAFVGVRGCDLAAIAIQDRVFVDRITDPVYADRRASAFIVAVTCSTPAATCFCTSMGTGPKVGPGHDLALTELVDGRGHRFLVEVGSERGAQLLDALPHRTASPEDQQAADGLVARATRAVGRAMRTEGIKQLLYDSAEHPRWDDVASRCLACTNCTLVCPTCFCHTVEDTTDLTASLAERWRSWDSCFTLDFSEMGGSSTRSSTRARYRQWLTHKLASWIDQFGTSGCVGCGRCITWCPVGIDITEEVAAMADGPHVIDEDG